MAIPLYGCDCYAYGLLAAGFCDLVVEADMKPYDYMALVPVVQGAGGVITDWKVCRQRSLVHCHVCYKQQGAPLTWQPSDQARPGEVVAAGDPSAHRLALGILQVE